MAHRADGLNDIFEHDVTVRDALKTKAGTIETTPTANKDIVNKEYVDSQVSGIDLTPYVKKDGTTALTADWNAGSFEIRARTLESDVANGTAPLTIASATKVTNLNADKLDGFDVGTSGGNIPVLNGYNTFSVPQIFVTSESPVQTVNATTSSGFGTNSPVYWDIRAPGSGTIGVDANQLVFWDDLTTMISYGFARVSINGSGVSTGNGQYIYIPIVEADCFVGETLVETPTGLKRIDSLQEGDEVYSIQPESGSKIINSVGKVFIHNNSKNLMTLNENVTVTPNHPFWSGSWKKASELKIGDWLLGSNNEKIWIYSIEHRPNIEGVLTYNLSMAKKGVPNYIANGFVAHNKCPFIFALDPDARGEGIWVYQNTILYSLDGPEKEATQARPMKTITNKFYLRELEPEESTIRSLYLLAKRADGTVTRLSLVSQLPANTKQGDVFELVFDEIPADCVSLEMEATGYYTQ